MKVGLALVLFAVSAAANAVQVLLLTHNQTSGSGAISTLITDGSHIQGQPASTAIFDWDGTTLTSTGLYSAVGSLGSSIYAPTILNDQIVDLSINPGTATAGATSYACNEGTFLSGVGANGCGGYTLGVNFIDDSTTVWSGVTVSQTLGGDDVSTSAPRVISAYDFDTVSVTGTGMNPGDLVMIGNGVAVGTNDPVLGGGELMTFGVPPSSAANDGPVTVPANAVTNIAVLTNDILFDDIATLTTTVPTSGTAAVVGTLPGPQAGLTIDYTSPPGFSGSATFDYTVTDALGTARTATVTVSNQVPVAVADSTATLPATPVIVDVLANDTLGDGPQTAVAVLPGDQPANGNVVVTNSPNSVPANIVVTYTPNVGQTGPETFTYTLTDDNGDTATALVTVTTSANLTAVDDAAATEIATPVVIDVLANDGPLSSPDFTVDVTTVPTKGTVTTVVPVTCTVPANCALTYTPTAGQVGNDSFVYQVTDSRLPTPTTDTATVAVFINDAPVAVADPLLTANTAAATTLDVQANDTGLSDTPITVAIVGTPDQGGTAVPDAGTPQMITYTSAPGFVGTETFTYNLLDSKGNPNPDTSNTVMVTVTVDDQPVANDNGTAGTPAFMVPESTMLTLDVLANDTGLSDTPLTVTLVNPAPTLGTPTVTGSPGVASAIRIDYVAGAIIGVDSFGYQIMDASGDTSTATAFVAVTDVDIPMAFDDADTTDTGMPVSTNVLTNDTGLADTPLMVTITTDPANGTIGAIAGCDQQATCLVPYTPAAGFAGTDTYQYMVTDNTPDNSNIATVTITVNDLPVAVDDAGAGAGGVAIPVDVLANDTGLSDTPLAVTITTNPANGTIGTITGCTQAGMACQVPYTADAAFTGTDTFQYTVTDNDGDLSTATVTMTVTASVVPDAVDDSSSTFESEATAPIDVLANDTGLNFTPLIVTISTDPTKGTVEVQADNTIIYTPDRGFTVGVSDTDIFEYKVTDANNKSSTAQVLVTVILQRSQSTLPSSNSAVGPAGLGLLLLLPWLRRRRRSSQG